MHRKSLLGDLDADVNGPDESTRWTFQWKWRRIVLFGFVMMAIFACAAVLCASCGGRALTPGATRADIVFVVDATGSMSGEIDSVKQHLTGIGNILANRKPAPEIRFGAVFYRDLTDKELVRSVPLSKDLSAVRQAILDVEAMGGGDWPEHVGIGLHKALEMDWSHSASTNGTDGVRLIYLVGDAPPKHYDDGYDVPAAVKLANELGVKIHVIGCDGIGRDQVDFEKIAAQTGGQFSFLERGSDEQRSSSSSGARGRHSAGVRSSSSARLGGSAAAYHYTSEPSHGPVVGIDLGSTSSAVGIYKNGRVEIIPNDAGHRLTPSYVSFIEDKHFVGEPPLGHDPSKILFDFKRLMGREFKDPEVQRLRTVVPYKIREQEGKTVLEVDVEGESKRYSPEEVSAKVLLEMKRIAESYLGKEVHNAVITVPANFNDAQRRATKDAGTLAGLNVLRIINEPTAAAIAFGMDKESERNVLVYHLGGGTFEVSILTIDNGVFEVLASDGEPLLGGSDFDARLVQHFIEQFQDKHEGDLLDARALQKLRRAAQQAKKELSSSYSTFIEIPDLFSRVDFNVSLSRAKFESLNMDLLKHTMLTVERTIQNSGLNKTDIDHVVLVGGSSRIPKVQQLLKDFFAGTKADFAKGINPDEAVTYGAATQGGTLSGEGGHDLLLLDVTPLTLGFESTNGTIAKIVPRNTVIPTTKSQVMSTSVDNQDTVTIRVYEGERPLAKDNHKLAEFNLSGIPPAKAGQPQIQVTFEIDSNGILVVGAEHKGSGKSEKITITNDASRLSEEEIEKMIKDAELHFAEDRKVLKDAGLFGEPVIDDAEDAGDYLMTEDAADGEAMEMPELKGFDSLSKKLVASISAEL